VLRREDDGAQGGVDEGFEVALADACVVCWRGARLLAGVRA